jgi:hypothetical protein
MLSVVMLGVVMLIIIYAVCYLCNVSFKLSVGKLNVTAPSILTFRIMAFSIITLIIIYDNEYSSIINIYFYATFSTQISSACAPETFLDTLSHILDKC